MSMNREQKRMMQRQGEVDADGEPIRQRRQQQNRPTEERAGFTQFIREVRAELRKVCLLYTSPSPRDKRQSRMPSSA